MSTTKTEQKLRRPGLPQSVAYSNLKQTIINAINQSGFPPWILVDMLANITVSVQTTGEQMMNAEMKKYSEQLEAFENQNKEQND